MLRDRARQAIRAVGAVAVICMAVGHAPAAEEVVFSVSWGAKTGQAGLVNEPERERCGPLSFCVEGGDVFLLDSVNRRVLRGQAGGAQLPAVVADNVSASAICGDGHGGLWLREGARATRLNRAGNMAAERNLPEPPAGKPNADIEGYGLELLREPGGRVTWRALDTPAVEVAPHPSPPTAPSPVSLDAPPDARPPSESSASPPTPLSYSIKRMNGNELRILGLDPEGKVLLSIPVKLDAGTPGAALFKGLDDAGNLYVEVERLADGRAGLEVHRYRPDGARDAAIHLPNQYFTTVYKKTEVGPDGSVYQLRTTPDGVQVVRHDREAK